MRSFSWLEMNWWPLTQYSLKMAATQDKNWVIIQKQLAIYEQNFNTLRDCDQLLIAKQQPNFIFGAVSSLVLMIHASVKSYCSALCAFRINILNFFPALLKGYLSYP